MILEIRWSLEAEITFDKIYHFVKEQWGLDQAEKLRFKVLDTLDQRVKHPHSFKESEIKNIRKAVISKQTSLFYEVLPESILLVFFWDNRQNPLI